MRNDTPGWKPIGEVMEQIANAASLPGQIFGPDGHESLSSKLRRAVYAEREFREQAKLDPSLAIERARRMAGDEGGQADARREVHEADQYARTPNALRAMGLAEKEIECLGCLAPTPAVLAVKAFMASPDVFFTIGGVTSGGKTIAAASVLLDAKERFASPSLGSTWLWATSRARFISAAKLAHLSYYGDATKQTMKTIGSMHWLIIDDLGAENTSDVWHANLYELIYERERAKLKTIITTNVSADTLEKRYGARVMRRLRESGRLFGVREKFKQEAA